VEIWKAIRYLYPTAVPLRDYEIRDDGTGAAIVAWHLPQPQPTAVQLQTACDAYDAREAQAAQDAAALRQQVVTTAQSAVGVAFGNLTAAQVKSLLAVVLYKAGALDKAGVVLPLNSWI
jgi:hypothetical protein